jgi:signal transduction histidine kinase/ActR/RegA family two-component response regulator
MFSRFIVHRTAPEGVSLQAKLDCELLRLYCHQARNSSLTGLLSAAVFSMLALPGENPRALAIWFVSMAVLYVLRFLWIWTSDYKKGDATLLGRMAPFIDAQVFVASIGWGIAAWLLFEPSQGLSMHMPILLVLAGVLTMSAPQLSARPLAGVIFLIPIYIGLLLRMEREMPDIFILSALTTALLGVFSASLTYQHHLGLRGSITTRLEKEAIFSRLVEAKERAEETAGAKSSFLATMSHEIRTPVNGLMGMLEVLRETELTSTQINYLNTASRSAEALLQLLNDILDYSRIEVGRLELERVPFDWIAMTGEIAMMNRVLASDKGIAFHLDIPAEGTSIVLGDPTRLRQILNNLLSNALKFTHEGSVSLKATIDNETPERVILSLSVKDTGIGIEPAVQERLFQQFQQANAATTRHYGGSGLGLAISQQLAHLMGGNIRLQSSPGHGSEFILTVPFQKASSDALKTYVVNPDNKPIRYRAKVLIVEDDPISQRVTVLLLKSFGIIPTVVNNGEAAIMAEARESFDIIFMDCRLPDMNGFEAARIIRKRVRDTDGEDKGPVIVALTGVDTPEDRRLARECGVVDFMTKPVRKRDMRLCLDRWVGKQAARP